MFGLSLEATVLVLTSIWRPKFWFWSEEFCLCLVLDVLLSLHITAKISQFQHIAIQTRTS